MGKSFHAIMTHWLIASHCSLWAGRHLFCNVRAYWAHVAGFDHVAVSEHAVMSLPPNMFLARCCNFRWDDCLQTGLYPAEQCNLFGSACLSYWIVRCMRGHFHILPCPARSGFAEVGPGSPENRRLNGHG